MSWIWYFLPLLAGACVCFQSMINSYWNVKQGIHAPIMINGLMVALCSVLFFLFGSPISLRDSMGSLQPWVLFNGILGFTIITIIAYSVPKIGVTAVVALTILAQLSIGLLMDHIGWLHLVKRSLSVYRLLGVGMVLLGSFLITKF